MTAPTEHRPWPLPPGPWIMSMRWEDLAFFHWPVDPEKLRPLIPSSLELGLFDGQAWLGVTPFRMSGVRARCFPALPWLSTFPELNVRTYVSAGGKPGVWFFSLDAANPLAVRTARWTFALPYYDAQMLLAQENGAIHYRSMRMHRGSPAASLVARYWPTGAEYHPQPGNLDYWLTERYCLYAAESGHSYRGEIHHAPWPLQPAEAEIELNTMAPMGIELERTPPLVHFAKRLDVVAWLPTRM